MPPRRGYKSLAEEIAREVREELGLGATEPLDPFALAEHLRIPVAPFSDLLQMGLSRRTLGTLVGAESPISAFTAFVGPRKLIYYNHTHSGRRTNNSLAHELAHVLLEHEPLVPTLDDPSRTWNRDQETEADWLGGALLVPRVAALAWLESGGDVADGAAHYGVSERLFRWRVNHTGVARQLAYRGR